VCSGNALCVPWRLHECVLRRCTQVRGVRAAWRSAGGMGRGEEEVLGLGCGDFVAFGWSMRRPGSCATRSPASSCSSRTSGTQSSSGIMRTASVWGMKSLQSLFRVRRTVASFDGRSRGYRGRKRLSILTVKSGAPSASPPPSHTRRPFARALKKKGDEITVACADVSQRAEARQGDRGGWRFACACARCVADGVHDEGGRDRDVVLGWRREGRVEGRRCRPACGGAAEVGWGMAYLIEFRLASIKQYHSYSVEPLRIWSSVSCMKHSLLSPRSSVNLFFFSPPESL
jgi:hypothetical protein